MGELFNHFLNFISAKAKDGDHDTISGVIDSHLDNTSNDPYIRRSLDNRDKIDLIKRTILDKD